MQNLKSTQHAIVPVSRQDSHEERCWAWDASDGAIIAAEGPTGDESIVRLLRYSFDHLSPKAAQPKVLAEWEAPSAAPDKGQDRIINVHYFPDISVVCLIFGGGDIVHVRVDLEPGQDRIEIVGSVAGGIQGAAWSPDEELLVLVTDLEELLFMSRDLEPVAETTLSQDDLKASSHVSVGWGKAETQFRGKGARALRDPTVPEHVDAGIVSKFDDGSTTVDWRGDGAYVAVNSRQASPRRLIRVYTREGVLDAVSEPVDGLESALSWRPAGNLVAAAQRLDDDVRIIFFERNGLRHGEFPLRLSPSDLHVASSLKLAWNVDSSILAVALLDRVQFWTMSNYHYYLKHEIRLPSSLSRAPSCTWHPEDASLVTFADSDHFHRLELIARVHRGPTVTPRDSGLVAVIDGSLVHVTPLRCANIPPPMALQTIAADDVVLDMAFQASSARSVVMVILTQQHLSAYTWDNIHQPSSKPRLLAKALLGWSETPSSQTDVKVWWRQIAILSSSHFIILGSSTKGSVLLRYSLIADQLKRAEDSIYTSEHIRDLQSTPHHPHALIADLGSELSLLDIKNESAIYRPLQTLSAVLDTFIPLTNQALESVSVPGEFNPSEAAPDIVFMTRKGRLFHNNRLLTADCTSFVVTTEHIIFTTTKHLLKFVAVQNGQVPSDTVENDERCRHVERGAKIVTVCPSSSALVLQMPRGNLETIYPRALVLAEIRHAVKERNYRQAFLACRNQRVDMNILYDLAPDDLLSNIDRFLDQLKRVDYIDLFLSALRSENVCETMYKDIYSDSSDPKPSTGAIDGLSTKSKVNCICDAFLKHLKSRGKDHLQNVITAQVCKHPPDLEAALQEVARLSREFPDSDAAVEHVCFLVDVNKLFNVALGLYDLTLALSIAERSQKDPREYLPLVQGFQDANPLWMRFKIDDHLGRHAMAIQCLHQLDAHAEVNAYAVKHCLYKEGLRLYRHDERRYRELLGQYAQWSMDAKHFEDAGVAFEYLDDPAAATNAYRQTLLWRETLTCAQRANLDQARLQSLVQELIEMQETAKDLRAVAAMRVDYLDDLEGGVRAFCRASQFDEAMRLVTQRHRNDLLETVLDPCLGEAQAMLTELCAECRAQLNAQLPRLREIRTKKEQEPLAFYDADNTNGADIPDNVSLAATDASTTGGSLFTRYTNQTGTVGTNATRASSKNRRREERKRARGKKGSAYEEEYLVNSIGRLIERINSVNQDTVHLVKALMRRAMRERAHAVESAMMGITEACQACHAEVFETQSLPSASTSQPAAALDHSTPAQMQSDTSRRAVPHVLPFKALGILGG